MSAPELVPESHMANIFRGALWVGLSVPFSTLSPPKCGVFWATDFIRLAYLGNRVHFV